MDRVVGGEVRDQLVEVDQNFILGEGKTERQYEKYDEECNSYHCVSP